MFWTFETFYDAVRNLFGGKDNHPLCSCYTQLWIRMTVDLRSVFCMYVLDFWVCFTSPKWSAYSIIWLQHGWFHAHSTPRMWFQIKWRCQSVHGCVVHTERAPRQQQFHTALCVSVSKKEIWLWCSIYLTSTGVFSILMKGCKRSLVNHRWSHTNATLTSVTCWCELSCVNQPQ